jgi:hypothetical protein
MFQTLIDCSYWFESECGLQIDNVSLDTDFLQAACVAAFKRTNSNCGRAPPTYQAARNSSCPYHAAK